MISIIPPALGGEGGGAIFPSIYIFNLVLKTLTTSQSARCSSVTLCALKILLKIQSEMNHDIKFQRKKSQLYLIYCGQLIIVSTLAVIGQ